MKEQVRAILLSYLILSVYSSVVLLDNCPKDDDWPQTPSGKDVTLFCNPLHQALPFAKFENIFRYNIPPFLRQAIQYEFDDLLRSRECMNGTWKAVAGDCPEPAGCWRRNFMDFSCNPGYEVSGFLCYPECKPGYDGVGPVCWEHCPPETSDKGVICVPNNVVVQATKHHCPRLDPCGLVSKCTSCPDGYKNLGCLCTTKDQPVILKKSYGRGVGVLPQFPPCPSHLTSCGILCTNGTSTCHNVALVVVNDVVNAIFRGPLLDWITALGPNPAISSLDLLMQLILSPECTA